MPSVFIRSRVADFDAWKKVFDEMEPTRRSVMGATSHSIHRGADDPNALTVAFRVSDLATARAYASSEELKAAMQRGGVQGPPEIWFAEDVEDRTY